MCIDHCKTITTDSRITVFERGKAATFINDGRDEMVKTKFDGCVPINGVAADWIVSKQHLGDVIIELKGKNVEHGAKQIHATAQYWRSEGHVCGKIAGLLVCTRYPRASTSIQKSQQAFQKLFSGPLHVVTKNYEYQIENVLSFKGPHRR